LRARHIGILMQSGNLFDHLSLRANLELKMRMAGAHDREAAGRLLDELGLAARRDSYPSQLSGGELARGGLAVALSCAPPILLADEPTAEVDADTETQILDRLLERRDAGMAMMVVTHSEALAARADRVLTIRDGRLDGT
jgi:putative ABC transport system ATP-binding protein